MSSKREREYERRRFEKWQERQAVARVRQRRQRIVAGSIAGGLVAVLAVVIAIAATNSGSSAAADPSPTPTSTLTAPDPILAQARTWTGDITFNTGKVGISLDGKAAPQAVANFITLASNNFFNDTKCHRVTTDGLYVLQCGSPDGTGNGGPGYTWGPIENAPADGVYPKGTIAMARVRDQGSSMGSQFFIVYKDTTLPADTAGGYTVFGKVTSGIDVIEAIADAGTADGASDGAPKNDVIITKVETQ